MRLCQPYLQELGIIQRPLPAEASSSELKANDMGCCNINCFDYDYASPPLTPAVAVAPQQAPQQAPVEAPQQAPALVPSTAAAAAGQNETNLPAAADAAPAMFTQQPRGMPLGAAGALVSEHAACAATLLWEDAMS